MLSGCIIYRCEQTLLPPGTRQGVLYTSAWAFGVARFDWMGDARASMRGTSDSTVPHAFFIVNF